jgi:DNA mismatch repair protein MutS
VANHSILFGDADARAAVEDRDPPAFFADLNLDQVVDSITAGRDDYRLKPFFYRRLRSVDAIAYRHEIFRDLERRDLYDHVAQFTATMRTMREYLAQAAKLHYRYQKEAWFLDAVDLYCDGVARLGRDLQRTELGSRGFHAFRDFLEWYVASSGFTELVRETKRLKEELARITYCIQIKGSRVRVSRYEDEPDYSAEVESTFEKFKLGAVKDYRAEFPTWPDMNHVEGRVLGLVAQLYDETFSSLDAYCERHRDYLDATVGAFDREVQFYVAYLEYVSRLQKSGLRFCYPRVSDRAKEICARQTFDIALANRLVKEGSPVVCNDFELREPERVIVVTGPNQGGKTTFARMFGQLHHLASIGCPVPGAEAGLFLFDHIFTHFEKEEDLQNLVGKLEDDLVRIREILEQATENSIVIMNESFTSTTLRDALFLGKEVMQRIVDLGPLCVCVTFVDELASFSDTTVSMASTVVPENPAERTYKVVRKPADGLAYAWAIAEKYGLTYERLKARVAS